MVLIEMAAGGTRKGGADIGDDVALPPVKLGTYSDDFAYISLLVLPLPTMHAFLWSLHSR